MFECLKWWILLFRIPRWKIVFILHSPISRSVKGAPYAYLREAYLCCWLVYGALLFRFFAICFRSRGLLLVSGSVLLDLDSHFFWSRRLDCYRCHFRICAATAKHGPVPTPRVFKYLDATCSIVRTSFTIFANVPFGLHHAEFIPSNRMS